MYFYCTTKIKNFYKVGIADSLNRVKKRLTTYRSANPKINIKFFSDIGYVGGQHVEYSFKNKFNYFRIGRSECYKLNFDIIYKHFLKFQHKFKQLHHFWHNDYYFLADYYFDKSIPNHQKFEMAERDLREGRGGFFEGFIPIAKISYADDKQDKKGLFKINAKILDVKNVNLNEYKKKYYFHIKEKWYGQQAGYANNEMKKFLDEYFKIRKSYKADNTDIIKYPVSEIIFNIFDNKYKNLTKKYPKDPEGVYYWQRPEQKSILGQRSVRMTRKIMSRYEEKYNIIDALRGISSVLPSNDPITYLETLHRIISGNDFKAPDELKKSLENMQEEILNLIGEYSKRIKIDNELDKQYKISKKLQISKIIPFKKIKK